MLEIYLPARVIVLKSVRSCELRLPDEGGKEDWLPANVFTSGRMATVLCEEEASGEFHFFWGVAQWRQPVIPGSVSGE